MPCITSIVARWVSSAPRAASTTAAALAAHQQDQPQSEQSEPLQSLQQRSEAGAMSDEARSRYRPLDRLADHSRAGTRGQVDVDHRRHRQIGPHPGRAQPAFERSAQILRGTCSTRVTPAAARAAAIAAGALAAPSAIWIE